MKTLKDSKANGVVARPELLSPAGNMLALKAAVANGADAVYLGLKGFNARRAAENFSPEELKKAIDYAHLRRVKVYVAFNILVAEAELATVAERLVEIYNLDADGLIIQDWGVYELAKNIVPDLPLHASTQMNVHNSAQAKFLEEKGFKRVVLARELTLEEIAEIRQNTSLELEAFIHGSRCFSYSGQCFFSSMVGGRSGNRGLCTQPCRLAYELYLRNGRHEKVQTGGKHILSTKDLCAVGLIPELVRAGVDSFKIEGRLKSPEYVAIATKVYRQAIERFLNDPESFEVASEEIADLKEAFNRDFTKGFFSEEKRNDLMSYRQASHRGVLIGRVSSVDVYSGKVGLLLQNDLYVDDEVEFWVSKGGRIAQKVKTLWVEDREVKEAKKGDKAIILISGERHLIKPGDRVFRTLNQKLVSEARASLRKGRSFQKIPIAVRARLRVGGPVWLEMETDLGEKAFASSDFLVEKAKKKPVDEVFVKKQLSRLNETPYEITQWQIELDETAMVSREQLNQLRRQVAEKLDQTRLQGWARRPAKKTNSVAGLLLASAGRPLSSSLELVVAVSGLEQAKAAVGSGADWIYFKLDQFCPVDDKDRTKTILEASEFCRDHRCRLALITSNILHDDELEKVVKTVSRTKDQLDAVVVGNLGLAYALKTAHHLIFDYQLNFFNPLAYLPLARFKPARITLSPELNRDQLKSLIDKLPVPVEVLAHGSLEVLIAEHCVLLASAEKCETMCAKKKWAIKDAQGYVFPLELDGRCRSHLFNSRELCLFSELPVLQGLKAGALRLMLERYSPEEIRSVTRLYRDGLEAAGKGKINLQRVAEEAREKSKTFSDYTRGHFYRGVQ